jgi:SAM-dependent methyltransferase
MMATDQAAYGFRQCGNCGAAGAVKQSGALWPRDWACQSCGSGLAARDGFVQLAPQLDEGDLGYDPESFDFLETVESGHFWFRSRNTLIGWLTRKYAPHARRVMEIGCGTGFVLNALKDALPGADICGSELHSRGLVIARNRHGASVELVQMDARRTGLSNALDMVGAFDVLEHIEEDEAVLAECARMLRPGGVLIATVPQHRFMWSAQDEIAHHVRRYERGELGRKAGDAGLETVYQSSFVSLAFPLMAASRLLRGRGGGAASNRDKVEAEFRLPWSVNSMMFALQNAEHLLRRAGVKFPFGGSQVLVARKPGAAAQPPSSSA